MGNVIVATLISKNVNSDLEVLELKAAKVVFCRTLSDRQRQI